MFVKVVGIPAIFDDSQLLAGYRSHLNAYVRILMHAMILSVDATDYCLNFKNKCTPHTHTHTHAHAHERALETIYRIIFQLNEIF